MRPAGLGLMLAVVLAGAAGAAPAAAVDDPYCVVAPQPKVGLSEVSRKQVSARLLELTLRSEAMGGEQKVNVLLPAGYDAHRRYPVLYLLHGSFGSYQDWIANGAEQIVGGLPLIVVMPDDGVDGSYSDWYGSLAGTGDRAPAWETYHVRELVPFIDRTFPTVAGRAGRFIAGLSSGGGGAAKYAAANPGMFGAMGAFSGAVDTDVSWPVYPTVSELLWLVTLIPGFGPEGHCTWGSFATQQVIWRDNEATYKAAGLKGTALWLASGDGTQGPYDANPTFDPTEWTVNQMTTSLIAQLDAAKIPHTDELYGPGTHTWPYWKRDLAHFLVWLKPRIGHPPPVPATFDDRSAREQFSAWGWSFTAHRDVREFTYLQNVSDAGLDVTGSGTLDVVTPPVFKPGRAYTVGRADDAGRLRFTVDLGPSHQTQQTDFGDTATDGWTHKRVVIAPA